MAPKNIAICVLAAYLYATDASAATSYSKSQVTSGAFDHKWPSINNNGNMVWSQKDAAGFWQVFMQASPTSGAPVQVTTSSQNHERPVIGDNGDIVYFKDQAGGGIGYQVVRLSGGVESIIEFSSRNNLTGDQRVAGKNFGIAPSTGTTISYYDFVQSGFAVRRFNVSGVGTLQCFGGNCDFFGLDYPDINKDGVIVYSDDFRVNPPSIYKASTTSPFGPAVAVGRFPHIADGPNPELVYITPSGQVVSTLGGTVDAGLWADVNNKGDIVYEKAVSGISQIFIAQAGGGAGTINVTTNLAAATFTINGPATYSGSGMSFTQPDAPTGTYTITFGAVPGFIAPMSQTQTLAPGGAITFSGTYQPCTFTLSPSFRTIGAIGGSDFFTVIASDPTCSWTATSPADWIKIVTSGGTGNGPVKYAVDPNISTNVRLGIIFVGGQSFILTQPGLKLTLTLNSSDVQASWKRRVIPIQPPCPPANPPCSYVVPAQQSIVMATAVLTDTFGLNVNMALHFDALPADLQTDAGHRHLNLIDLDVGQFYLPPLADNNKVTGCTTMDGTCTLVYVVSEASGKYVIRACIDSGDSNPCASTTGPVAQSSVLVRELGLVQLGPGFGYILVGSTGQSGGNCSVPCGHPSNHYAIPILETKITQLAATYAAAKNGTIEVNDMSLPWGGLFDIYGDWETPHVLHRTGHSVDINHSSLSQPNQQFLTDRARKLGFLPVSEGANIHYELP